MFAGVNTCAYVYLYMYSLSLSLILSHVSLYIVDMHVLPQTVWSDVKQASADMVLTQKLNITNSANKTNVVTTW